MLDCRPCTTGAERTTGLVQGQGRRLLADQAPVGVRQRVAEEAERVGAAAVRLRAKSTVHRLSALRRQLGGVMEAEEPAAKVIVKVVALPVGVTSGLASPLAAVLLSAVAASAPARNQQAHCFCAPQQHCCAQPGQVQL